MPEHLARPSAQARRFLTFRVDGRLYALPGEEVTEIIRIPPVARLPYGPRCLMGLANLRGTVLPLIDPRPLLGLAAFAASGGSRAIVLSGAAPAALAVDGVDALVGLSADEVETRQAELAAEPGETLRGAFRTQKGQTQHDQGSVAKILDLPAMLGAAFGERREPTRAAAQVARTPAKAGTVEAEQRLLSFAVADQEYALPLEIIREIVPLPVSVTTVPRAEAVLLGVIGWRDGVLPLLSLRGLLGFTNGDTSARQVIVAAVGGVLVGLVADRVRAIIRATARDIDAAPSMLAARTGGEAKIAAIYRGDGGRHLVSVLAPDQLFREDVMRRLGETSAAAAPVPASALATASVPFVVFHLGDAVFALPVNAVDEVARVPEQITRVPKTPAFLEGVINLRGDVLPVVDQRRRFDMPVGAGDSRRMIVVRSGRHRSGLIVDGVSEVLHAPAGAIAPAPELTGPRTGPLIEGVINMPESGRMILLLDPVELLTPAERGVLDALDLDTQEAGDLDARLAGA